MFRSELQASSNKIIELPGYYSQESGPDLEAVAALHRLSINELIQLHSSQAYQVYAIGFAPGFAYLGFTDPRISTPRLANPRPAVAAKDTMKAKR